MSPPRRSAHQGSRYARARSFVAHGLLDHQGDYGLLAVVEGLLQDSGIPHHVADRNMSVLEGSILVIQQRVLVPDRHLAEARALLVEAELDEWLTDS